MMMNSSIGSFQLRLDVRGMVCFVAAGEEQHRRMLAAYKGQRKAIGFRNGYDAAQRMIMDNKRLVAMEDELACMFSEESIPVRIRQLYAWLMNMKREDCVEVCFCDATMLAPSGDNLLSVIPRSRIRRVGLLDRVGALDAIGMVSSGWVDACLAVNDPSFSKMLQTYSDYGPMLQVDGLWRELPAETLHLLTQPGLLDCVGRQLELLDVDEHILLPVPLGLLCRTKAGKGIWIQLELKETQIGAVEILREEGLSTVELTPILQGEKAACIEVLPALRASAEAIATWADITIVNVEPWVGMAVFELPDYEPRTV